MPRFDEFLFDEGTFGGLGYAGILGSLLIDGVDYLGHVRVDSLVLSRGINGEVPTLAFTLRLAAGLPGVGSLTIEAGNTVVFTNADGAVLFTGYLSQLKPTRVAMAGGVATFVEWACVCQDQLLKLMALTQTAVETFTSQTVESILAYLFGKYAPSVILHISDTTVLSSIDLSNASLRQAVERARAISQSVWYPGGDGGLNLHPQGYILAPFGFSTAAESTSPLLDGFSYSQEFTQPCNKATVVNMLAEVATTIAPTPTAGTDDADAYKSDGSYPPGGSATLTTTATSIGAENTQIGVSATDDTFSPADSGAVARANASTWPPSTPIYAASGGGVIAEKTWRGGYYNLSVGVMVFDTSTLPDDAVIAWATLDWSLDDAETANGASMWMDWGPTVVDVSAYTTQNTASSGSDAMGGTINIPYLGTSINLINLSNIHRTGLTGLRIGIFLPATPTGVNAVAISSPVLTIEYTSGGATYKIKCAMVRFDTSAIGAGATITGATLRLKMAATAVRQDASSALGVEHYAGTNWPLDTGDYTATPSNSAAGYTNLSALPLIGQVLSLPLANPDATLSKTGYSGFRIHVKVTGTPTGENSALFASQESAGDPVLEVTYIPGDAISGTYSDAASIAIYGTLEHPTVVNAKLLTQAEAEAEAESYVVPNAWPVQALQLRSKYDGLDTGQLLHVTCPDFGLDDDFLIRQVQTAFDGLGNPKYTVSAGDFRLDLVQWLRAIALKTSQQ